LRPSGWIIAIDDGNGAKFAGAMRHVIYRLALQLFGVRSLRLLGLSHRGFGNKYGQAGEARGQRADTMQNPLHYWVPCLWIRDG
jgi:hypothetical protein